MDSRGVAATRFESIGEVGMEETLKRKAVPKLFSFSGGECCTVLPKCKNNIALTFPNHRKCCQRKKKFCKTEDEVYIAKSLGWGKINSTLSIIKQNTFLAAYLKLNSVFLHAGKPKYYLA